MGLMFVMIIAGCQPPQQGAVCPSVEEEEIVEPEPTVEDGSAELQKIPPEELAKARRRLREYRRGSW